MEIYTTGLQGFKGVQERQVWGKKRPTAVTKPPLREENRKSQHYFAYGILPGSQTNQDIENVTEILNAREKSAEYLLSS